MTTAKRQPLRPPPGSVARWWTIVRRQFVGCRRGGPGLYRTLWANTVAAPIEHRSSGRLLKRPSREVAADFLENFSLSLSSPFNSVVGVSFYSERLAKALHIVTKSLRAMNLFRGPTRA